LPLGEHFRLHPCFDGKAAVKDDAIYFGDPEKPQIGDLKITYTVTKLPMEEVSVLAGLTEQKLDEFHSPENEIIAQIAIGQKDIRKMLQKKSPCAKSQCLSL